MDRDQLTDFSRTFRDSDREKEFVERSWKSYSASLRAPLILLGLFVSAGMYLDHMWYAFGVHFFAFASFRLSVTLASFYVAWLCFRERKPIWFDQLVWLLQFYFLIFIFAVFYDRMYLNDGGIVSESFFTVLFVTYPLLVFYVIRGSITYALVNSLLALATYTAIVEMLPQINLQNRITEILVFSFFIYYAFILQRRLNTEERKRFVLKQKQEAAIKLAKKESVEKSRFIAGTSHDLRQPLHALSLHMDLLDHQLESDHKARDYLNHAKTSISSLNELLTALLDISKLDARAVKFNLSHFHLHTMLERMYVVYSKLASSHGMTLRLHNPERVVHTDPIMLERALGNLLDNAIQHARGGNILMASRRRNGAVRIEVWDQGPGIPADQTERIFSEYHQLESAQSQRRGGLGLGLSIVRRICKALKLGLSVLSTPGKGSVFAIDVPAGDMSEADNLESEPFFPPGALSLSGKTIVLIDDDIEVRHAMQALFENWGCPAIIASDKADIFNKLSRDNIPDLIVSDLNLPGNVSGEALITEIRDYFREEIPAMLITGNTRAIQIDTPDHRKLLLLYKPLRAVQLRLAISRLLQEHAEP